MLQTLRYLFIITPLYGYQYLLWQFIVIILGILEHQLSLFYFLLIFTILFSLIPFLSDTLFLFTLIYIGSVFIYRFIYKVLSNDLNLINKTLYIHHLNRCNILCNKPTDSCR